MAGIKIIVDRALCESNEVCVSLCPEVFRIDDNGTMVLLTDSPDPALREKLETAVRLCPRQALALAKDK